MKNFLVHDENTRAEMLESIGLKGIEDLFKQIPQTARMGELNLEKPLSEMDLQKRIKQIAKENKSDYVSFVGGGIYNRCNFAGRKQV